MAHPLIQARWLRLALPVLVLSLFMPLAGTATAAPPAADVAQASCNWAADLSGTLSDDGRTGVVTNASTTCSYPIGIASYRKVDNVFANQSLYDYATTTIGPGARVTLRVQVPNCAAQVDLFYGKVLFTLHHEQYGNRKLDYVHTSGAFCTYMGGRFTGGGSVFTAAGQRVTHGFNLRCDLNDKRQNLEINWGNGERFHLEQLTSVRCIDDPAFVPEQPRAGFDTYIGTAQGRLKGNVMGTAEWIITDAGEPGVNDRFRITVKDSAGNVLVTADGLLNKGNHQAHR